MLCVQLGGFKRQCQPSSSGVAKAGIFDPNDFDFTQAVPTAGVIQPYSALALTTGASGTGGGSANGAKIYTVDFEPNQAQYTYKRADGRFASYEHEFKAQLLGLSQDLTNFYMMLDAASYCCGIGLVLWMYNGKVFVVGESSVNGNAIAPFLMLNSTSDGDSGKAFADFSGGNLDLKGTYSRPPIELQAAAGASAWSLITPFI